MPLFEKKHIRLQAAGMAVLFLALLYLCWLFPVTGDDWYREKLGLGLGSLADLAEKVVFGWNTSNGRIMGNILAYSAGGRKVLRELLRSSITLGTIYLAARHMGLRTLWGTLLAAAALLALPREMFRQIYPWAAGFFNYVPPVLMVLAALWLMRAVFDGARMDNSAPRAAAVFLLGFGGQLYVENNTLYAVCAGFALLVWYGWRQRKLPAVPLAFFLGTVLGAALLFASPAYGLIWGESGGYQAGLSSGLSGLLSTVETNQAEVLRYLLAGCPVLFVPLTALGLVWFARSERRWPDWLAAAALVLGCLYFAAGCLSAVRTDPSPLAVLLWGLALGLGCWRWLPEGERRNRALFFWGSAAVAALPLLFVTPIGPRCLYLSYVFLLLTAGNLLSALPPVRLPAPVVRAVPALLAAAALGYYVWIFQPIHQLELKRDAIMAQAMASGRTEVTLPAYPHGDYLWEGDSAKIQILYYYDTPGDLAVSYVPLEQWDGEE